MDVERTMQFILDMQAKQAASLEEHREWLHRHDAQIADVTGLIARLAQAELRLVERIDEMRRAAEERDAALDEKLGILLDIVDKMTRRNGHTQ